MARISKAETPEATLLSPEIEAKAVQLPPDPFIGKTIGNCEIIEKINEGGTSLIYRAHNKHFDIDRVVKILKPALSGEDANNERFKQEAQLIARFDHPHILRVYDTGEVGGYFFIEMEHLNGQTLREYISANPRISEQEVLSFASQLVNALQYAHSIKIQPPGGQEIHGILHRDIKPENVMITNGKFLKLMDFGAAKALNITSNTMQGMIVGTFHYMSPEQITGNTLDARSDFFSLGILLYELLIGQRPFTSDNLSDLISKIKRCKYPKVRSVRKSISPLTEELIDRLLSRDPSHRPSSAAEIGEIIQHSLRSYANWGPSRKVIIPYSVRRQFSTMALLFSSVSLLVSGYALVKSLDIKLKSPFYTDSPTIPLLEQGRNAERKEQWTTALHYYSMTPSIDKGGLANEYLEAQVRMAAIMINNLNQYSKARRILESLKSRYSDPAIDSYLGRVYYELGLYSEAKERLDNALKSTAGSIIPETNEFKREILYYSACSIHGTYTKEEQNQALLVEALKAWNFYIEFSRCGEKPEDENCINAQKQRDELAKTMPQ
jgi:serine/threonine protein kinase